MSIAGTGPCSFVELSVEYLVGRNRIPLNLIRHLELLGLDGLQRFHDLHAGFSFVLFNLLNLFGRWGSHLSYFLEMLF